MPTYAARYKGGGSIIHARGTLRTVCMGALPHVAPNSGVFRRRSYGYGCGDTVRRITFAYPRGSATTVAANTEVTFSEALSNATLVNLRWIAERDTTITVSIDGGQVFRSGGRDSGSVALNESISWQLRTVLDNDNTSVAKTVRVWLEVDVP
jgi:hypothetical protein